MSQSPPVDITGKTMSLAVPKWQRVEKHPHRVDEVGNLLQDGGAVVPKACQRCKKEFTSTIVSNPITDKVPTYTCDSCQFTNSSAEYAWDHEKANPGHHVTKSVIDRIVGTDNIITGNVAVINVDTNGNTYVTCRDCWTG